MTQEPQPQPGEILIDMPSAQSKYFADIKKTITCLQKALRELWPAAAHYPNDIDCYNLAVLIGVAKTQHNKKQQEKRAQPQRSALVTAAKKFQRELVKSRAELISRIPPEIIKYYEVDLQRVDTAKQSVAALLDTFKRPEPYNTAKEMGERLIEAWRRAGETISRGVKPDDAFCKAVTKLLELGGICYSPEHVSDMLRGRTQRPRSGRARNAPKRAPLGAPNRRNPTLRPAQ